jgi:hypothetical protein
MMRHTVAMIFHISKTNHYETSEARNERYLTSMHDVNGGPFCSQSLDEAWCRPDGDDDDELLLLRRLCYC